MWKWALFEIVAVSIIFFLIFPWKEVVVGLAIAIAVTALGWLIGYYLTSHRKPITHGEIDSGDQLFDPRREPD